MNVRNAAFITLIPANKIIAIMNTHVHVHAQRLLRSYFSKFDMNIIDINDYAHDEILTKNAHLIILVTEANDPKIEKFSGDEKISYEALVEGAFILRTMTLNQQSLLLISGGGISGVIYAINELGLKHLWFNDETAIIPSLNIHQTPALAYRFFWTWDHSTNWYLEQNGMQEIVFANPYSKPKEGFLEDY